MYALVPAPIPPAVDTKVNPHVDTQGTSWMSIFACIYHRSAFSFVKTKRKAPFNPTHIQVYFVFGTWHVGHHWEYPHEKVHDSTSHQASCFRSREWSWSIFAGKKTPKIAVKKKESAGGSSLKKNFPSLYESPFFGQLLRSVAKSLVIFKLAGVLWSYIIFVFVCFLVLDARKLLI